MRPNEAVLIADCDNANRFETYIFEGEPGSGVIGVNGAAARLTEPGHRLIICTFCQLDPDELDDHAARVVVVDRDNRIAQRLTYRSTLGQPMALD
jgi:aspartate 1-decarboxylase